MKKLTRNTMYQRAQEHRRPPQQNGQIVSSIIPFCVCPECRSRKYQPFRVSGKKRRLPDTVEFSSLKTPFQQSRQKLDFWISVTKTIDEAGECRQRQWKCRNYQGIWSSTVKMATHPNKANAQKVRCNFCLFAEVTL